MSHTLAPFRLIAARIGPVNADDICVHSSVGRSLKVERRAFHWIRPTARSSSGVLRIVTERGDVKEEQFTTKKQALTVAATRLEEFRQAGWLLLRHAADGGARTSSRTRRSPD
jgi:hypothetical protein